MIRFFQVIQLCLEHPLRIQSPLGVLSVVVGTLKIKSMNKEVWHDPTRLLRILLSGIVLTIDKKESKTKVDQQKSFSLKFSNWNLHFSQNSTSSVYIPAFPDLHRHLEVARRFGKGRDSETLQESNCFRRIPLRSKPAVLLFQLFWDFQLLSVLVDYMYSCIW
jgi:hypothetical protein